MNRRALLALLPALLLTARGICAPSNPNFTGTWKQSNERSTPARTGNVTLKIEHHDPEFTVETFTEGKSGSPRHALQHYTTDGNISNSTGADGDAFRTAVVWSGLSLAFSIEEHEDGRVLHSQETWTLIDNGTVLERRRSHDDGGKQTVIYLREINKL
jgi:hypothetical protein